MYEEEEKKKERERDREGGRERERGRQKGEERCHQPPKPRQWTVTNCAKFNPRLPGTSLFGMEMSRMQMRVAGEWPSTVITYKDEARIEKTNLDINMNGASFIAKQTADMKFIH